MNTNTQSNSEGGSMEFKSSSQATPPVSPPELPKKKFTHQKKVSIDICPMTPDEIEWALTDASLQEEEREIQEIRERLKRRKEEKAAAAAAAAAASS